MALVQRLPHDPEAIDIGAIQRRKAQRVWQKSKDAQQRYRLSDWRRWFLRWWH